MGSAQDATMKVLGRMCSPKLALHRMQPWGNMHAMSILTPESWMLAAHSAQPWGLSPTLEMVPSTFRKILRRRRLAQSLLQSSDIYIYI